MNVNGGDIENATTSDYVMHFLTFGWKVWFSNVILLTHWSYEKFVFKNCFQLLFAFVPPAGIWGGWLSFVVSLVVIGALTAIVGDLASIFGCLVGLNDAVTGNLIFVLRMRFMRVEEIQTELRKKKKELKRKERNSNKTQYRHWY